MYWNLYFFCTNANEVEDANDGAEVGRAKNERKDLLVQVFRKAQDGEKIINCRHRRCFSWT